MLFMFNTINLIKDIGILNNLVRGSRKICFLIQTDVIEVARKRKKLCKPVFDIVKVNLNVFPFVCFWYF